MESITDLQQHIRKRLTEIEDLDERKDAREILLEGLVPIFERMEKRYLDLENQIKREIEIPNEKYAVSMTVIKKEDYDPINGTLYPVFPALLQEDKEQEKTDDELVIGVLNNNAKTPLFSVDAVAATAPACAACTPTPEETGIAAASITHNILTTFLFLIIILTNTVHPCFIFYAGKSILYFISAQF